MYLLILIENGKYAEACRVQSLIFNLSLLPFFCFVFYYIVLSVCYFSTYYVSEDTIAFVTVLFQWFTRVSFLFYFG